MGCSLKVFGLYIRSFGHGSCSGVVYIDVCVCIYVYSPFKAGCHIISSKAPSDTSSSLGRS